MIRIIYFLFSIFLIITYSKQVYSYEGSIDYLICDLKRPLAGLERQNIDETNYKKILEAFKFKLKCNGIRIYIDPEINDIEYPEIYRKLFDYSRNILGMVIYANPLGTGTFGKDEKDYCEWIVKYAKNFSPDFLGIFNEPGISHEQIKRITECVRSHINKIAIVGPDLQKVEYTKKILQNHSEISEFFDIVSSHNAAGDDKATSYEWKNLSMLTSKEVWASENPRNFSEKNFIGEEIGIKAIIFTDTKIKGLVLYLAYPRLVNNKGQLTNKGAEISRNIGDYEKPLIKIELK